jgi:hypothetical protein
MEIFAIVVCAYFANNPKENRCQVLGSEYIYRSAEGCEQKRRTIRNLTAAETGISDLKYVCARKTVSVWEPVN